MKKKWVDYSTHLIKDVSDNKILWDGKDPVRPWFSASFRTSNGRKVYGLLGKNEVYSAFVCVALTTSVPRDESDLKSLSSESGTILVPYTVWSNKRGAGKALINKLLDLYKENPAVSRTVTLSPLSLLARKFHLKNGAIELSRSATCVNFEY